MRVAIMSFAHLHAEAYVHNLKAIPSVEFIGFADEEPSRGAHFAQAFDIPLFESYEALLAAQPDAVVVCSENAKHRPLVEMAARQGVHILCEKPLATSVEDAQAMVEICQAHDVLLMTAFPMRFSTPLLEVKKSLESNQLGRIFACNSVNQGECPKHIRSWFVDKDLAGGGQSPITWCIWRIFCAGSSNKKWWKCMPSPITFSMLTKRTWKLEAW